MLKRDGGKLKRNVLISFVFVLVSLAAAGSLSLFSNGTYAAAKSASVVESVDSEPGSCDSASDKPVIQPIPVVIPPAEFQAIPVVIPPLEFQTR